MLQHWKAAAAPLALAVLLAQAGGSHAAAPSASQGVATVREYRSIGGVHLSRLKESPRHPGNPDAVAYATSLEWPAGEGGSLPPTHARNRYGWTISGYLYPPTNGVYTFHLAASDEAEFWLSADENPSRASLLCREPFGNGIRAYLTENRRSRVDVGSPNERLENVSVPVTLSAGRPYWFQALAKEGGGGENLAVTWTSGRLRAVDGQAPIPGEHLSSDNKNSGSISFLQQPAAQSVSEGSSVKLSVEVDGTPGFRYQWKKDNTALTGATNATIVLRARLQDSGDYSVEVSNREGARASAPARLTVTPDTQGPAIGRVNVAGNLNTVLVSFNEALEKSSAEALTNYTINAGITVQSASLSDDGTVVFLKTSPHSPGQELELSVSHVKDTSAAGNLIAAETKFRFKTQIFTRHFATLERFRLNPPPEILDGTLHRGVLDGNPAPVSYATLAQFEAPTGAEGETAARLHAHFIPQTTARYVFYSAASGPAALYLGSDEDPRRAVLIAAEPQWNLDRDWLTRDRRNPEAVENKSAPIALQAGKRYYLALAFREGEGGDGGAITVKREEDPDPRPGSAALRGVQLGTWSDPNGQELEIVKHPTDQILLEGRSATFQVEVRSNSGAIAYQWKLNGVDIPGANAATYATPPLQVSDTGGKYSVEVTIPGVIRVSREATVTVQPDREPPRVASVSALRREATGSHEITVAFDEEINAADGANAVNFSITPGTITRWNHLPRSSATVLAVKGLADDAVFTVSVKNIRDRLGNLLPSAEHAGTNRLTQWAQIGANELRLGESAVAARGSDGFDLYSGGSLFRDAYDEASFVFEKLTGDFDKKVRIQFQDPSSEFARAGLMVREVLNEGQSRQDPGPAFSRFQAVHVHPSRTASGAPASDSFEMLHRAFPGSLSTASAPPTPTTPEESQTWVRLKRVGQEFSMFRSSNGSDWMLLGRQRYPDVFGSIDPSGNPVPAFPETLLMGPFYAPETGTLSETGNLRGIFKAEFRQYSDVIIESAPGPISISTSGNNLRLTWSGPAILQSAPAVDGPWTDVLGAVSPHTVTGDPNSSKFFRLRR